MSFPPTQTATVRRALPSPRQYSIRFNQKLNSPADWQAKFQAANLSTSRGLSSKRLSLPSRTSDRGDGTLILKRELSSGSSNTVILRNYYALRRRIQRSRSY